MKQVYYLYDLNNKRLFIEWDGQGIILLMKHQLLFGKNDFINNQNQRQAQYNIDMRPLVFLANSQSNYFRPNST